jgi:hypothetical protein
MARATFALAMVPIGALVSPAVTYGVISVISPLAASA